MRLAACTGYNAACPAEQPAICDTCRTEACCWGALVPPAVAGANGARMLHASIGRVRGGGCFCLAPLFCGSTAINPIMALN